SSQPRYERAMPLYGFGAEHRGKQGPRPGPAPYPSQRASGKPQASKLFDLSMDDLDDFDNMSDLENLNFTKISGRPVDSTQPASSNAHSRGSTSPRFQLVSPPRSGSSEEPQSSRAAHSQSFSRNALRDPQHHASAAGRVGSLEGQRQRERRGGHERDSSQLTLLSDDEAPLSPRDSGSAAGSGTLVDHRDRSRDHTPGSHRAAAADADAADDTGAAGVGASSATNATGVVETPAYKLPPHPKTEGSNVTTRWRRRGRLGLAKPKRYDTGAPSDDNDTNGHDIEAVGLESSPPGSFGFLASSSSSIEQKRGDMRLARSPPRSFASGYGSMESIDGSYQPGSLASLDEAVPGDVEHTFQTSRARLVGKNASMLYSSQESVHLSGGGGAASGAASYEGSAAGNNTMDMSDVSMASGPRSRPQSPESEVAAKTPDSAEPGSHPPSRELLSTPDGIVHVDETAGSPKHQWDVPASHGSPRQRSATASQQGSGPAGQEKRATSLGEPAMDLSTRFQQYEKRLNDMSPQYRSPRERQRILASTFTRSSENSPAEPTSAGYREDPKDRHSAERQRIRGSSASLRGGDHHSPLEHGLSQYRQSEERPVSHSAGYASPRLSARRATAVTAAGNNFEVLRGSTPAMRQEAAQTDASSGSKPANPKRMLAVNGRPYQKISITGRGGSSKVYKAMSAKHEIFAIKRVSFSRADVQTIEGYMNEIILLRKFEGNPYIIQLFDAEINKERGLLHMVMEFGETDLANVLKRSGGQPLGMNTIRLYWEQMLRAVQTIHEERVVHADLKPANYLLVKGSLKLIDFGIAKAIGNDTTNIHRESQIGTVNYMSPEAIKENNPEGGRRIMKLGRASDIWSLGIILYQMCYGHTPFAQLALFKKLASIPDPSFVIPYPRYMAGCLQVGTDKDPNADGSPQFADGSGKARVPADLLRVMRVCLQRDPDKRMSIPDLLVDPLLCPTSLDQALPSAMAQMLSLLKRSPQVLEQWDVSEAQNEKILGSLVRALHQQELAR
ncbi:Dual-specificity kinase, spindle pole body (SPB) duplication and spindle checkpoint function, partial [Coemansia biformis]